MRRSENRRLALNRETVRALTDNAAANARGGVTTQVGSVDVCTWNTGTRACPVSIYSCVFTDCTSQFDCPNTLAECR